MRRVIAALLAAVCLAAGCQNTGGMVYTGQAPEDDPSVIRGPAATGATRDSQGRGATRTRSNPVDIPVYELAYARCRTEGYIGLATERCDARLGRLGLDSRRATDRLGRSLTESKSLFSYTRGNLGIALVTTRYAEMGAWQQVFHRNSSEGPRALSMDARTTLETGEFDADAHKSRRGLDASSATTSLEAGRTTGGLEQMSGRRVIGLHLWKYADRDAAMDDVVITYTLVYYNTNTHDTGPTEITEPVPFLTEYVDGSATLPKEGVSVELTPGPDRGKLLRWAFPRGIKAGETNKMSYKVRVRLTPRYESRSEEIKPPERP